MRSGIHAHGTLERVVVSEAERWGWKAAVENIDEDPQEIYHGKPKPCPGRGDVVLQSKDNGATVAFEYELPEDVEDLRWQVRSLIEADKQERDRREAPWRDRPVEIGE